MIDHCKAMTSTEVNGTSSGQNTSGLRPWKKGQSGNPNGRRAKGLASAERLRNALVEDLPEILRTVTENAKQGDITAAKVILERVLPPLKAVEMPTFLESLTGTLSEQGRAILDAMANGSLTPGQAAQLLGAIAAQGKIIEVDELARRLEELEKRMGVSNGIG
jgi:hypothetical protein